MKLKHAITIRISVGLLMLALATMRASADVELLNGGFANGVDINPDVWVENSLDLCCRHEWGSHDGDNYLMGLNSWVLDGGTYAEFYQDVTNVVAGNTYVLSFWQEGDSKWSGSNVTGRILWLDDNTEVISSVTTNLDAYTIGGITWTRILLAGTAPSDAIKARVQFDAEILPVEGGGAAKFDDMTFTEYTGLLLNPGFAEGVANDADFWTEYPTTDDAGREAWGDADGDGYLMGIPAYKSGAYGTFYQDVKGIKPGSVYTLNLQVSGQNDYTGSNVFARLIWMDNTLTPLSTVSTNLDALTVLWSWTPITMKTVPPGGASRLRVQFDAESASSGGAGAAKFDALSLTCEIIPATIILIY
ncbi:MAG: hypothetical protein R6V06_07335 [Kiritimatiellia bacterium]